MQFRLNVIFPSELLFTHSREHDQKLSCSINFSFRYQDKRVLNWIDGRFVYLILECLKSNRKKTWQNTGLMCICWKLGYRDLNSLVCCCRRVAKIETEGLFLFSISSDLRISNKITFHIHRTNLTNNNKNVWINLNWNWTTFLTPLKHTFYIQHQHQRHFLHFTQIFMVICGEVFLLFNMSNNLRMNWCWKWKCVEDLFEWEVNSLKLAL